MLLTLSVGCVLWECSRWGVRARHAQGTLWLKEERPHATRVLRDTLLMLRTTCVSFVQQGQNSSQLHARCAQGTPSRLVGTRAAQRVPMALCTLPTWRVRRVPLERSMYLVTLLALHAQGTPFQWLTAQFVRRVLLGLLLMLLSELV